MDLVGFSVHQSAGALDDSAEAVADALVAEADAQDGDFGGEMLDDVVGDAAFLGRTGAGGDDDVGGPKLFDFGDGHLVVAKDLHRALGVDLAEPLDEVVGEGVVVIDENDHDKSVRAPTTKVKPVSCPLSVVSCNGQRTTDNGPSANCKSPIPIDNPPMLTIGNPRLFGAVLVGWIISVILHAFSHGVVAYWGGGFTIRDRRGH